MQRLAAAATAVAAATAAATTATAAAPAGLIGQKAPDFALPAVAGSNVRLSEYRGQPVIVSFWSSTCRHCAVQLATLARLYSTYRLAGLIVLAVSVDDDPVRARQYAQAHPGGYPMLLDSAKAVGRAFAIDRLPWTTLIDRSGVVRYLHGDDSAADAAYVAQIRALLDDNLSAP
jgi:peroxiredoxin